MISFTVASVHQDPPPCLLGGHSNSSSLQAGLMTKKAEQMSISSSSLLVTWPTVSPGRDRPACKGKGRLESHDLDRVHSPEALSSLVWRDCPCGFWWGILRAAGMELSTDTQPIHPLNAYSLTEEHTLQFRHGGSAQGPCNQAASVSFITKVCGI